jgi:rubrerythrin
LILFVYSRPQEEETMKDKEKLCETLGQALALEDKGKSFYEKAAKSCQMEECRGIFKRLAADEDLHKARIQMIYDSLMADKGWCDWRDAGEPAPDLGDLMRAAVRKFGRQAPTTASDVKALQLGIDMEAASMQFYSQLRQTYHNRLVKTFIAQLISEEITHYRTLTDMKFYLEDPAGWFQEHERGGLDGA